jgi:glycosyltransferase involved in cell wall biosynthesis
MKHKVLLDDVAFQLNGAGIARYWDSLLQNIDRRNLATDYDLEFILLNRTDKFSGLSFELIDFQDYDFRFPAADRLLISEVVKNRNVDVFCSTYYTSSCTSKNLVFVYDLIPETFGFSEMNRGWLERKLAIFNASAYICISKHTESDLFRFYQRSTKKKSTIIYPGLNKEIFLRPSELAISRFKDAYSLRRYYITVGSRFGEYSYKNGKLIQLALESLRESEFDIVYIGGEAIDQRDHRIASKLNCKILQLSLDDEDMVSAMGGAEALIYPSLCEGFGMPPLESLALGVPVICTNNASLSESTGKLNEVIDGSDHHQLAEILKRGVPNDRKSYISKVGPIWAANFSWDEAADSFCKSIKYEAEREASNGEKEKLRLFNEYTEGAVLIQTRNA